MVGTIRNKVTAFVLFTFLVSSITLMTSEVLANNNSSNQTTNSTINITINETIQETPDIGYEVINSTTHVWNQGSIKQDYYYTGECNNQISNIVDEQWEIVTLGITYGNSMNDLVNNYVEWSGSGCSHIRSTDNLSFINLTSYKQVSYLGKSGLFAKNSYIELEDDYMKETFYFKSNSNINQDLWFVIKRDSIDIGSNSFDDFLILYNQSNNNQLYFNLSYFDEHSARLVLDQDDVKGGMWLRDEVSGEDIMFYFDYENKDYKVIIDGDTLYIAVKAGTFVSGQSKQLETFWVDKGGSCSCLPGLYDVDLSIYGVPSNVLLGSNSSVGLSVNYQGSLGCAGSSIIWESNYPSWDQIPQSGSPVHCDGISCHVLTPNDNIIYNKTLVWNGTQSLLGIRGEWYCEGQAYSPTYCNTNYVTIQDVASNETIARNNILTGITNEIPSATISYDKQIYIIYSNGNQMIGTFDVVAEYNNQTWAFNYLINENSTGMQNLGNNVIIWENQSLTNNQITTQIRSVIEGSIQ